MSETSGNKKGPVNLDVTLREWPHAEKSTGEWEDRAQSVLDRLKRGERGATAPYASDENLLAEPLGQSAEDGHNSAASGGASSQSREGKTMTMPADRERDRRSLQELAKMATGLTPPPASVVPNAPSGVIRAAEAKADDSGLVDLAAASAADPGAAARAQSTPLAAQGLFDDEPARAPSAATLAAAPASIPAQPVPSMPPPSVGQQASIAPAMPAFAATPVHAHAAEPKKKGGAVIALVIGGVVALSAAAAGGLFMMKSRDGATASAPTVTTAQPAVVAQAEPSPAQAAATPAPAPEPEPTAAPADEQPAKVAMAAKPAVKGGAPAKGALAAAAPAAKAEGPAKMTEKDLAAAPSGPAGDLGAAMKKEVGDEGAKATPAAAATGANAPTGNVPQKPSQGAVTGAIGAVLPGARACLGPDDPVSRASIVFTSAGTVQSVNVSGAAAGKPAEACIKGALMKAKVAPFAEPTYTANITVRHN